MGPTTQQQNTDSFDPITERNIRSSIRHTLREGRGAAIICVGDLDQGRISKIVTPDGWASLTVEEALKSLNNDKVRAPSLHDRPGITLTGYSNRLNDEQEQWVQGVVRSNVNRGQDMQVIVLSDTLPREDVFKMDFWWYNGPFENNAIHSMSVQGQNVILKSFRIAGGWLYEEPRRWEERASDVFR